MIIYNCNLVILEFNTNCILYVVFTKVSGRKKLNKWLVSRSRRKQQTCAGETDKVSG